MASRDEHPADRLAGRRRAQLAQPDADKFIGARRARAREHLGRDLQQPSVAIGAVAQLVDPVVEAQRAKLQAQCQLGRRRWVARRFGQPRAPHRHQPVDKLRAHLLAGQADRQHPFAQQAGGAFGQAGAHVLIARVGVRRAVVEQAVFNEVARERVEAERFLVVTDRAGVAEHHAEAAPEK